MLDSAEVWIGVHQPRPVRPISRLRKLIALPTTGTLQKKPFGRYRTLI